MKVRCTNTAQMRASDLEKLQAKKQPICRRKRGGQVQQKLKEQIVIMFLI